MVPSIEDNMATAKTTTLTFRIDPGLKEALRTAADREHRSIANMVEVMIRDHCGREGIAIAEPGAPLVESQKTAKNGKKK
jgi:hypothetical protein